MSIFLAIFYYFYFSIIGVYVIFIPKVLSSIGYSASEIGILLGAAPLVRFILPFLFIKGLKLDAKMFNLSLVILVIASLCFYLSVENFYQLLLSNIFLGIGLSLVLPYVEVISLENIGKQRYGKVRLFGSIGFIVVALVLAKFLSAPVVALNFLLTLTWITAVCAFIIGGRYKQKSEQEKTKEPKTMSILGDIYLWGGLILMQISFGSFYNFFTIYETDHGVSLDMTVYLWSFGVLVEIVMLFSQGKLLANSSLLNLIRLSVFASAFRWFLVFVYPENLVILFFSQSLHALSFALFHSATISYLYQIYHNKQLSQQFFMGLTYGLGGVSGAVIAGYIYEYYPSWLFLSSSVFALIGFVMLMRYKHRHEA
ncbi:MFS transporter [Sulfurimonas marina]|uniref:MFS transporter n=1 Tax=Sulfurimonas marina TaxID=2590551 RepID=A0A7M3V927_9BACT|nr:MFS transporter [Sulfurimonas marina]QOP40260.1 MFS transporter [Sulfurimonas marina]